MTAASRRIRLVLALRDAGITDHRVISAIEQVPRELFVPETLRHQAYEDTALPIGHGQTVSQPSVVAFMTQALAVEPGMKVLEIGTGSGYQTAVLARLCRRVYTIERHTPLHDRAMRLLETLRIRNVTAIAGDGSRGWPEVAPFDRIIVTAAAEELPAALTEQLATGGIMVLPIGGDPLVQSVATVRRGDDGLEVEHMRPVRFVPLVSGPDRTVTSEERR